MQTLQCSNLTASHAEVDAILMVALSVASDDEEEVKRADGTNMLTDTEKGINQVFTLGVHGKAFDLGVIPIERVIEVLVTPFLKLAESLNEMHRISSDDDERRLTLVFTSICPTCKQCASGNRNETGCKT